VHGIGCDDALSQAQFTHQLLDGRDLALLGAHLDVSQRQAAGCLKSADQMQGGTILEVIETTA
jgi:hypothetical protein